MKNISLSLAALCCMAAFTTQAPSADRLTIVKQYAYTVLDKAGDHYHGTQPSPLLASGVDPRTGKQLEWVFPDGRTAVLYSPIFPLSKTLCAYWLASLTGDERYQQRTKTSVRYYFDRYQDKSGLLIWGGHCFVDLKTLTPEGPSEKELVNELKNAYPYYELMFAVDKPATVRFIRAFWNAHVYDWQILETSRHGQYGKEIGKLWDNSFTQKPPFFATKGLSFLNAGNDLIYSALLLYKNNHEAGALVWAKRLAEQYVLPRDKKTGLGVYQFTQALKRAETSDDSDTNSKYGDRAQRQFGPEFGPAALEGNMMLKGRTSTLYSENSLMQLQLAKNLGKDGDDIKKWTLDGLKAFAKYAYDESNNTFRPMLANGTDLTNYTLPRNSYYGKKGTVLKAYPASSDFLLSYARAYTLEKDVDLWKVACGIAKGLDLGDIGSAPGKGVSVNANTKNSDPYAIFALIDLWQATQDKTYLTIAEKVADNIVSNNLHNGFFMNSAKYQYASIDSIDPYALLALEATLKNKPQAVAPLFLNGSGFTEGAYRMPEGSARVSTRDDELFAPKEGETLKPNGK